ncbi:unnamed protein product, partial [Polarella glacialis]
DMLVYLHLPVKQGKGSFNLGYCFVGFRTPELARRFRDRAEGFRFQSRQSAKIIRVEPARVQAREGAQKTMHGEVTWFGQQPQPTACLGVMCATSKELYYEEGRAVKTTTTTAPSPTFNMASSTATLVYVIGLLVCGSLNTITMKIAFSMTGTGEDGQTEPFKKPWLITFVMFVAMCFALLFDRSMWSCQKNGNGSGMEPLLDASPGGQARPGQGKISWRRKVVMVCIPAFFDILATGLCSMGFLYIPASVWQLLRGAEVVFAAFFAVAVLGRKLHGFHCLGLLFCVAGIALVGCASVWGSEAEAAKSEEKGAPAGGSGLMMVGIALALSGQVVQAAQVIAEEWLLKDVDLPGLQIVGFEGVWGALAMLIVVFPALYYLPGPDHGHLEDEVDSWVLLASNSNLAVMVGLYTFSCATYNMAGIAVTGALSAVHRVMLEALRTLIVWAFGLTVHYCISKESPFGESWTSYSWLEVAGFVLLICGQAIYGAMVKVPGLSYPQEDFAEALLCSPGAMRNFASPLPPPQH